MRAMKTKTSSRFKTEAPMLVARAMATTKARMLQAVTSSTAAQVIAVLPRKVFVSPRSCKIRASTGKAVMLIEMPMNKANAMKLAPGCARWL